MLVTLSPLSGILDRYKKQQFSSKAFFQQCLEDNRIHFVDGSAILTLLQTTYRKLNEIPTTITLNFVTPYIANGNVYIGIISSTELKTLYRNSGDALFLKMSGTFLAYKKKSLGEQRQTSK